MLSHQNEEHNLASIDKPMPNLDATDPKKPKITNDPVDNDNDVDLLQSQLSQEQLEMLNQLYEDLSLDLGTVEEAAVVMSDSIKRAIIDIELSEEFILNWLEKRKKEKEKKKSSKINLTQNQVDRLTDLYRTPVDEEMMSPTWIDQGTWDSEIEDLANDLNLPEEFIKNWLKSKYREDNEQ